MTEQNRHLPGALQLGSNDNSPFRDRRVRNALTPVVLSTSLLLGLGLVAGEIDRRNSKEAELDNRIGRLEDRIQRLGKIIQQQGIAPEIDVTCPTEEGSTLTGISDVREVAYYSDIERFDETVRALVQDGAIPSSLNNFLETLKSGSLDAALNLDGPPEIRLLDCEKGVTADEQITFNYNVLPFEEIGEEDYGGPFLNVRDRLDSHGRHSTELSFYVDYNGQILTVLPNRLSGMDEGRMIELIPDIVKVPIGGFEIDEYFRLYLCQKARTTIDPMK